MDRLIEAVAKVAEAEQARAPRAENWLRALAMAIACVARDYGVEREVFAELMGPSEFRAWEALRDALDAWPGPFPAEAPAWRRLACASTDEEREAAREELRRLGIDPTTPVERRR